MKRLILIMSFVLIGVLGYSQSGLRPIKKVSVLNATTEFGENIPTETEVTNMATGEIWECRTATASDETLTTAAANFTIVNGANTDSQDLSYVSGTHAIAITNGDTAVIPLGTTSVDGLMTSTKFNEVETNNGKISNVSTALSTGTVNATSYGITSDGGTDDVVLAVATQSLAGLESAADKLKLDGIAGGAEVNLTTFVESFEETSSTAATHDLSHTAIGAIKVSFNGVVLKPSQYTVTSTTVHIDIPVSQYDGLVVYYSY